MAVRFVTVDHPPRRAEFGDRVKPSPDADGPPPVPSGTRSMAWDVQAAKFLGSVARLPFKAIWNADKFYVDYARPFAKAMLWGRATRSEAKRRRAICEECPQRVEMTPDWFGPFQFAMGMWIWSLPIMAVLGWRWGLWLVGLGCLVASWPLGKKASFCKRCNCGTHGLARLDFKVRRAGSTCPVGLWEKSNGSI